jgi:hypothetical protein
MANISKNFSSQPASGGISSSMWQGGGGQSSAAYEPGNVPLSKNAYAPAGNPPVSKNFAEAEKAARAAQRPQGGKTHAAFRKSW